MTGIHKRDAPNGFGSGATDGDDLVAVDWDVRTRRRLRRLGIAESVTGGVDVVVVDRRGGETTPREPGELTVDGRRVVVVPDRSDDAPPVELWVGGRPSRYAGVVRTLRRTVALDERVDAAFESARRRHRRVRERADLSTDGGRSIPSTGSTTSEIDTVESVVLGFDETDTSLAVGGFATAVDPLR